jgi:hypothetical protein
LGHRFIRRFYTNGILKNKKGKQVEFILDVRGVTKYDAGNHLFNSVLNSCSADFNYHISAKDLFYTGNWNEKRLDFFSPFFFM